VLSITFRRSTDGATVPDSQQTCSLYMKELQQFVQRVASSYLAQFHCTEFIVQRWVWSPCGHGSTRWL